MFFGKVFTYCTPELILSIIVINGRYPDVRIVVVMILVYHMFEAKMLTFHRRRITSKGDLFFPDFQKFSCPEVRSKITLLGLHLNVLSFRYLVLYNARIYNIKDY